MDVALMASLHADTLAIMKLKPVFYFQVTVNLLQQSIACLK